MSCCRLSNKKQYKILFLWCCKRVPLYLSKVFAILKYVYTEESIWKIPTDMNKFSWWPQRVFCYCVVHTNFFPSQHIKLFIYTLQYIQPVQTKWLWFMWKKLWRIIAIVFNSTNWRAVEPIPLYWIDHEPRYGIIKKILMKMKINHYI